MRKRRRAPRDVHGANLEAARAYAQGPRSSAGIGEYAIAQYKKAITLDPELGRAYAGFSRGDHHLAAARSEKYYNQASSARPYDAPKSYAPQRLFPAVRKATRPRAAGRLVSVPADSVGFDRRHHMQLRDMRHALEVGAKRRDLSLTSAQDTRAVRDVLQQV